MRHKRVTKRKIAVDPKYKSEQIAKFANYLMKRGKKSLSLKILYNTLEIIGEKAKAEPQEVFDQAIKNATPLVEVKGRRIGGGNYQIPVQVEKIRGFTLASRWIINAARAKKGGPITEKLAEEILNAYKKEGSAIKKKEDVRRMAEANKAFAHFAYFTKRKKVF